MKRFGKVFLINILPRLVFAVVATVFLTWVINTHDNAVNEKIAANQKTVAEQQASVDNYTVAIKAAINKDQQIINIYNTQEDIPTKNVIAYDLIQHQSACTTLVTDYMKIVPTLPSYIKHEAFTTRDCLPLSYKKEN